MIGGCCNAAPALSSTGPAALIDGIDATVSPLTLRRRPPGGPRRRRSLDTELCRRECAGRHPGRRHLPHEAARARCCQALCGKGSDPTAQRQGRARRDEPRPSTGGASIPSSPCCANTRAVAARRRGTSSDSGTIAHARARCCQGPLREGERSHGAAGQGPARRTRPGAPRSRHRRVAQTRGPLRRGGVERRAIPERSRTHGLSPVPGTGSVRVDGCCRGWLQVGDRRTTEMGRNTQER